MASDLYSRYVPPKNTKMALQTPSISTLPASKEAPLLQHTQLEHASPQQPSHRPTPQPSSRPPKRKHENDDHLLLDQPRPKQRKGRDDISHHKALLLKRDKSAKKSEELVSLYFWGRGGNSGHHRIISPLLFISLLSLSLFLPFYAYFPSYTRSGNLPTLTRAYSPLFPSFSSLLLYPYTLTTRLIGFP
jgi:hypothetical protein